MLSHEPQAVFGMHGFSTDVHVPFQDPIQDPTWHVVVATLWSSICDTPSVFGDLDTLTDTGQAFCRMALSLGLSDVFSCD